MSGKNGKHTSSHKRQMKHWWQVNSGMLQRLRLWSGLVLFAFVLLHYLNHALGIVSLDAMESFQLVRRGFWRSSFGTGLLLAAIITHMGLAIAKTVMRRHWRMPFWELMQLILGLFIPLLLLPHVLATRGMNTTFGVDDTYRHLLSILWPDVAVMQSIRMLIVWVHAVIGLHFWLRIRTWYHRAFPWFLIFAVIIPLFAEWGWISAARRLTLMEGKGSGLSQEQIRQLVSWQNNGEMIILVVLAAMLIFPLLRFIFLRYRQTICITYPGHRHVRVVPGSTLLEISRMHNIPHASVCGGRARCSTCRTRILSGGDLLENPSEAEAKLLQRIQAEPDVRLACQLRPLKDISIQPLVAAGGMSVVNQSWPDIYHWGVEQPVAIMFVDMRGFTKLSEKQLPFDVVFLLNRYFELIAGAIRKSGGYVDKFIGDGVMAIFGMEGGLKVGCEQALQASIEIEQALQMFNEELRYHGEEGIQIGIGLHAGSAILGRIGSTNDANITALGDTVNIASRLETMTKEHKAVMLVSRFVLRMAGLSLEAFNMVKVPIRGRQKPVTVAVLHDFSHLKTNVVHSQLSSSS